MNNDKAIQLLNDYNDYLVRTSHYRKTVQKRPFPRRRVTKENLKIMNDLISWCEAREVDPRVWLFSLFSARFWTFAPAFTKLRVEKHLYRFGTEKRNSSYLASRLQRGLNDIYMDRRYDPNRDVTATVENIKNNWLLYENPQGCMESMHTTLGFHPKSRICARCPLAKECRDKLQASVTFDIHALRLGEITAEQARNTVALYGCYT